MESKQKMQFSFSLTFFPARWDVYSPAQRSRYVLKRILAYISELQTMPSYDCNQLFGTHVRVTDLSVAFGREPVLIVTGSVTAIAPPWKPGLRGAKNRRGGLLAECPSRVEVPTAGFESTPCL